MRFSRIGLLLLLAAAMEGRGAAPRTLLFLGDSITASGRYLEYLECCLRVAAPDRPVRLVNGGRSSETLSGLTESDHPGPRPHLFSRLAQELERWKPEEVIACYGINDGIYHPLDPRRFDAFQSGVRRLVREVVRPEERTLLLLTPPIYDAWPKSGPDERPEPTYGYKQPFAGYNDVLRSYAAWILGLKEAGLSTADLHGWMEEHLAARRQEEPGFRLQPDGIHPSATGHLLIALTVLKAWGETGVAAEGRLDLEEPGRSRGEFSAIRALEPGVVECAWRAPLPWPEDPEWDPGLLRRLDFRNQWNRHRLHIRGLPAGSRHRLIANRREQGVFTSEELEAGVDLASLRHFPTVERAGELRNAVRASRTRNGGRLEAPAFESEWKRLQALAAPVAVAIRLERVDAR